MSATSADKIRQAQAARRGVALKNASQRQARRKTSGTSPSPVTTSPVVNQQAGVSSSSSANSTTTPVVEMSRTVANKEGGSVSATSSDKVRQAQAARRAAAQKGVGQRQVRRKLTGTSPNSFVSMPAVSSQATATANSAVVNDAPASEVQTAEVSGRVDSNSVSLDPNTASVRQQCRARRREMSSKGKIPSPKRHRASRVHGRSSAVGLVSREASKKAP